MDPHHPSISREHRSLLLAAAADYDHTPAERRALVAPLLAAPGRSCALAQIHTGLAWLAESESLPYEERGEPAFVAALQAAERSFRDALAFDPEQGDARVYLARTLEAHARLGAAEENLDLGIKLLNLEVRADRLRSAHERMIEEAREEADDEWFERSTKAEARRQLAFLRGRLSPEERDAEITEQVAASSAAFYRRRDTLELLVEAAQELCALRQKRGVSPIRTPLDEDELARAVEEGVLDDDDRLHGWTQFHLAWSSIRAATGRLEEAVRGLHKAVAEEQLALEEAASAAAHLREHAGDLPGALAELTRLQSRFRKEGLHLPFQKGLHLVDLLWQLDKEADALATLHEQVEVLELGLRSRALRPHDREMYTLSLRAYRDHLEPERISMARENAQFYRSHPDRAAPASAPSGPLKM